MVLHSIMGSSSLELAYCEMGNFERAPSVYLSIILNLILFGPAVSTFRFFPSLSIDIL